ncbi:MAG TPA: hypothetical protein VEG32_12130 [Clostridia bacterium]|nr:hypothetical protein [Clostridia bacterium]
MSCETIREQLPDVANGTAALTPELATHMAACSGCAETLIELRQTMALLDEWQTPEPSPFFDVRLQARLREEQQEKQRAGWFQWMRRPALGVAAAGLIAVGVGMFSGGKDLNDSPARQATVASAPALPERGTAVADLEFLDNHEELLQDLDALDGSAGDDVQNQ